MISSSSVRCGTLVACSFLFGPLAQAQRIDIASRPLQVERSHDFDALHYRITINLRPETRSFTGEARVVVRALRETFDMLTLDAETFIVRAVSDAGGRPLSFTHTEGTLEIALGRQAGYGDTLAVDIRYDALNVDVDEERFGMGKGYDLGLSFKPATEDRSAIINTLSFPTGARHWFPCYDHPNDKATTEVIATVPAAMNVLSNGALVSDVLDDAQGLRTVHWLQNQPHSTYLTVLVAGEYAVIRDSLRNIPVNYWVYRADSAKARPTFGRTPEILSFFEEEFGVPYPWVKCDQVSIPGIGGGAESTTATVIGESAIVDSIAEPDYPSEWLVAHEAAHQWWGDLTTMRDWGHTWLNESFATYFEYVWTRHSYGADEGAWNLENKRRQYFNEASTKYRRPIVYHRWRWPNENFDSHTYPKGAVVIHMLRSKLGERRFRETMRHFLTRHAFASVETRDLLMSIREATGEVLDPFFDQWIISAGHPVLSLSWRWDASTKHVRLTVQQSQDRSEGVPLYDFEFSLLLQRGSEGVEQRIRVTTEKEEFSLAADRAPDAVIPDPEGNVLAEFIEQPSEAEEIARLRVSHVTVRRRALDRVRTGALSQGILAELQRMATRDPFWRLRGEAIHILASKDSLSARSLIESALSDPASGVRAAAAQGLAAIGSSMSAPALRALLATERSYRVRSSIATALGQCGDASDILMLREMTAERSHRDVVARAARDALRALGR